MRPLFEILDGIPAWEAVAARHGLSAWVADELAAAGRAVPPPLQAAARAQVAQGLKVKRLTLTVLDALASAGIVAVPLKGYGLATRLFPQQPLARPSVDVDAFVEPAAIETAAAALRKLGLTTHGVPGVADVEGTAGHRRAGARHDLHGVGKARVAGAGRRRPEAAGGRAGRRRAGGGRLGRHGRVAATGRPGGGR